MKIHKCSIGPTECGLPEWKNLRRSIKWVDVTCKNCLKKSPPWTTEDVELDAKEIFDEALSRKAIRDVYSAQSPEEVSVGMTPFEKWEQWFALSCDHSFSPSPTEVWNGAIDTVCAYLINEMCAELGLDETNCILNKAKKKFKTE